MRKPFAVVFVSVLLLTSFSLTVQAHGEEGETTCQFLYGFQKQDGSNGLKLHDDELKDGADEEFSSVVFGGLQQKDLTYLLDPSKAPNEVAVNQIKILSISSSVKSEK